jgi:hypothetical protein
MASQANLARLTTASASSTIDEFSSGAWRANDLRLSGTTTRFAWTTSQGPGAWLRLDWPGSITAESVKLYPLRSAVGRVTAAALEFSDGTTVELPAAPADGSPVVVPLTPPRTIRWLRLTMTDTAGRLAGVAEIVVNGPAGVSLPDIPPPAPTNLKATQGAVVLTWDRLPDATVSGYKIHYGTATGVLTGTIDTGDVTEFVVRDRLSDGVTYYFAAKAYNLAGTESLALSNEVTATARTPVVLRITPDRGWTAGDTPVTIKGRNFSSLGARVRIGGHAHEIVVVDGETITAHTRYSGPGTVDVIVSNVDDRIGILPSGFTYFVPEHTLPTVYLPSLMRRR